MRLLDALLLRLRSLFRSTRVEQDLDDELRFHVEAHVEELVAKGMSPGQARTTALRALGGVDQAKESVRDTWHIRAIRDLMQDLRYGVRVLTKAPAFTTVAVLTLALGIGATTAIFSVVDRLLLKPLQYPDADRIVRVLTHFTETNHDANNVSGGDLVDARDSSGVFSAFSWFYGDEIGVRSGERAELVGTWFVNTAFFDVFGVKPVAGRTFREDDVQKAAVISYGYAVDHYGSAPAALAKVVSIDTRPYEVVGVMPSGFHFPPRAEVWVPEPSQPTNMNRTAHNYPTVARVRPGLPLETARTTIATLSRRISMDHPDTNGKKGMVIVPLQERMVGNMRGTLYLLLGAVGVLFLIACANVANLLLARATVRTREMALRAALGADRWRIIRQLTVESLLLGLIGGALGLMLAYLGTGLLVRVAPADLPRLDEVHVDLTVLAFAATAAVVASLLFGLVPAWHASRVNLRDPLTEGGSKGAVAGGSTRLRTALAVAEIGLAVVLAIGGGVLFRSFMALSAVQLGYRTSDVLVIQANLPSTDDVKDQSRVVARYERLMPAIASVPGVQAAAATVGLPMGALGSNGSFAVEGKHTFAPGQDMPYGNFRLTTPGYFATIGTPLKRGRDFSAADTYDRPFVAIISEALARQVFPNEDPIGHRIQCGLDSLNYMTIVGIVGDIRDEPGTPPASELYMPLAQHPGRGALVQIVVRTAVPPATLTGTIDARIRQADGEVAKKFTTFDHIAADAIATPRFRATLVGAFAGLALLLAMAGVYGLLTYLTAQRMPELGVRMALGAGPGSVMRLVLGRAAVIGGVGLAIGLVLSLLSSRLLTTMVFGLSAVDWTTYAVVGSAMLIVTLLAAFVPAWRASRIDPLTVLRNC
jgi:putative ABC transport system permease protein